MSTNGFRSAIIACCVASSVMVQPSAGEARNKRALASPPIIQPSELEVLQKEKLIEDIKKLKLENQALSRVPTPPAGTSIPIIAACIAAVVALVAPRVAAAKQATADRRKERRLAIAQYGANYAAAIHHIQWLTWKPANQVPLTSADLDAYDNAMQLLFPPLIGSFLAASALNPSLFAETKELYDRIIDIDVQIGQHIAEVRNTGTDDGALLKSIHNNVNALWNEVPAKFRGFMESSP